jgi:hypothetical protein
MRFTLLAWVVFALVPVSIHGEEQANQPSQQKQKGTSPPQTQAAPSTAGARNVSQPATKPIDQGKTENSEYWKHHFIPEFLPNWLLFVVAAIGVALAWGTLKDLERQTTALLVSAEAAKKSVEVSEKNVRALTNIYRAWVLFAWNFHPSKSCNFKMSIKNWGQTPARVVAISLTVNTLTQQELANLSVPPFYQPLADVSTPIVLAPNEAFPFDGVGDAAYDGRLGWRDVQHNTKIVAWYGAVVYYDALTPEIEHTTRFCYWFTVTRPGLNVGGPPEYNETT